MQTGNSSQPQVCEILCIKIFGLLLFYVDFFYSVAIPGMDFFSLLSIQLLFFRVVFFLHSALLTSSFSPSFEGESSFFGHQQLIALPLACYEQLCSSCKKEVAGAGCSE